MKFFVLFVLIVFDEYIPCYAPPVPYGGILNDILDTETDLNKCVFGGYHTRKPEAFPEESRSKVECGGRLFNLGKIVQYVKPDSTRPLFGAKNVVDLMFTRIGNYDKKWEGDTAPELLQFVCCENHYNELFYQWMKHHLSEIIQKREHKIACGYPKEMDISKHGKVISYYRLTKNDAEMIFKVTGKVLHPGIGICKPHKAEIIAMAEQQKEEKMDVDYCPINPTDGENVQKDVTAQIAIQKFANAFDVARFVTSCDYHSLAPDTQRKKINSAQFLFLKIALAVAPNAEHLFLEKVCKSFVEPDNHAFKTVLLVNVADQYMKAEDNKMLKLYALSTVADLVLLTEMSKHIPNLTSHYFYEARKLKKMVKLPSFENKKSYIKYDTSKITKFLDFVIRFAKYTNLNFLKKS